ncbi:YesL family protein [Peribacillus loiseleuriae]|uniref:YesL family protein n=1 Tax=Peribacillus loiseleuriae TaxID=1679170 RepID=UPI0038066715
MNRENWSGKLYNLTEWIMRLAYLNLLWLSFTLIGFVVFGWTPATIAMHTITRRWILGQEQTKIFSTFLDIYRSQFLKSQKVGFTLLFLGVLLFVDMKIFMTGKSALFVLAKLFTIQLMVAYFVVLTYVFSIYVNFHMNGLKMFKMAFLMGLMHPIKSLYTLIGSFALIVLFITFPSITFLFGGSVLALWSTYNSHKLLQLNDHRIAQGQVSMS